MYDKVTLIIPRVSDTPNIEKYLTKGMQQTDLTTGEVKTLGSFHGLQVGIFANCIYINGSLSRLLYPNNIYPLDIHSTREAIESLSDGLHINVTTAKVTALEYGIQFVMTHPVKQYLPLLDNMPRLVRISLNDDSLYYKQRGKQQNKEYIFYDKIADAKIKGMEIPKGLENSNLLKYEMRLKARLAQQLKIQDITASTLYKRDFYKLLMKRYQSSYFTIDKKKQLKANAMDNIKTPNDALEILFARLIHQSNPDEINGFLEELKQAQVFNDSKYYTRVKNKLKDILNKGSATVTDELIKELDEAVENEGKYV